MKCWFLSLTLPTCQLHYFITSLPSLLFCCFAVLLLCCLVTLLLYRSLLLFTSLNRTPFYNRMTASQTMNLRSSFVLACVLILATTQVVEAGTYICSSMTTWYSCPHGGACMSWCMSHLMGRPRQGCWLHTLRGYAVALHINARWEAQ